MRGAGVAIYTLKTETICGSDCAPQRIILAIKTVTFTWRLVKFSRQSLSCQTTSATDNLSKYPRTVVSDTANKRPISEAFQS